MANYTMISESCFICGQEADLKCLCTANIKHYCLDHFLTHIDMDSSSPSGLYDQPTISNLEKSLITLYNYKIKVSSISSDTQKLQAWLTLVTQNFFSQRSEAIDSLSARIDDELNIVHTLRDDCSSYTEPEYSVSQDIISTLNTLSSINITSLLKDTQDSILLDSLEVLKPLEDTPDDKSHIISVLCSQLKLQVDKAYDAENRLNMLRYEIEEKDDEINNLQSQNKMKDEVTQIYINKVLENEHTIKALKSELSSLKNVVSSKTSEISRLANTINVLNSASSTTVYLDENMSYINSIALTHDDTTLVTGGEDCTVRTWNMKSLLLEMQLTGHKGPVKYVVVSNDDRYIASASSDRTVRLWNLKTGDLEGVFDEHSSIVQCVDISSDSRFIVSGGGVNDCSVRIWNLENNTQDGVLQGHKDKVMCGKICRDNQYVVTGGGIEDRTIRVWNLNLMNCEAVLKGHKTGVYSVVVNLDGRFIISGSGYSENTIRIWNFDSKVCESELKGHCGAILSLAISSDGNYLVSGSYDNTVRIWNLKTHSEVIAYLGHTQKVWSVAITHDDKQILSSSYDKTIKIWNLLTVN